MIRWHENEATLSRKRQASVWGGVKGKGEGRGKSRRKTVVDESRREMADKVVRYQSDYSSRQSLSMLLLRSINSTRTANCCVCLVPGILFCGVFVLFSLFLCDA